MKARHILLSLAGAALLAGCSLKEDLSVIATPDNSFDSAASCQQVINSCYIPMKNFYTYTYMLATECCTDIAYCPSGTLDARLDISPATPRHGQTVWTQCYTGVQRCNFAIKGIENSKVFMDENGELDTTNSKLNLLLCEAKVLRAFYYYTLTCFFGDVPFYFDDINDLETLDRIALLPRMSAVETRNTLIEDLKAIAPLVPQTRTSDNENHRLGAACAWMLIAKMAMWNRQWETAIDAIGHLEEIYGDFSQYDYAENAMFRNKNTPESILEIQHEYVRGGISYTSNVAAICMPTPRTTGTSIYAGVDRLSGDRRAGDACESASGRKFRGLFFDIGRARQRGDPAVLSQIIGLKVLGADAGGVRMHGDLNAGDRAIRIYADHHGQSSAEGSSLDGHDIACAICCREDFLDHSLAVRASGTGLGCDRLILCEVVRLRQDFFSGRDRYFVLVLQNDRVRDLIRKCQRERHDQTDAAEHDDGGRKLIF